MARVCDSDPLEKFRFLVDFSLPGSVSPARTGFHDIQMPKRATNKIMYREGQQQDISSISAGLSTMEDIVMNRGVIAADGLVANDFIKWCSAVKPLTSAGKLGVNEVAGSDEYGAKDYRSDVVIKMLDRAGVVVRAWKLYNAFPMNFVPGADLNASEDGEKSLESLTLTYEDFQELAVIAGVLGAAL